ncbi:MAG: SLATT domain-containing protein [Symploca sp. SIO2G7]|nr:SLATT domain-containing protein [Symploca sp. SIO2G7]
MQDSDYSSAKKISSLNELYRRLDITTSIRYNSAVRLSFHHKFSQWVVTLVSVSLIVIPLFQAMEVPLKSNPQSLDAVEVLLAVIVLVYSLLLGNENYSNRSEKMQACGLELGRLSRKIYPYLDQPHNLKIYESFLHLYHNVLDKYPNHDQIDYKIYRIKHRKKYYTSRRMHILDCFKVRFESAIGYWHYTIIMIGVIVTLLFIFRF